MMDGYCTWCGSAGSCDCYSDNPPQRPAYTNLLSDSETQSHLTQPGPDDGLVERLEGVAIVIGAGRTGNKAAMETVFEAKDRITALSERIAELTRQLRDLAVALGSKHYPKVTQWKPLDDAEGILSQIDNMTTGLERSERIAELERVVGLTSEASIERLATDIAIACVDCREEIRKARHAAMIRLGKRLRQPLDSDLAALKDINHGK